jgi:hypothetical protein
MPSCSKWEEIKTSEILLQKEWIRIHKECLREDREGCHKMTYHGENVNWYWWYINLSRIDHCHELTWRCGSLKRYSLYAKSWGAWHSWAASEWMKSGTRHVLLLSACKKSRLSVIHSFPHAYFTYTAATTYSPVRCISRALAELILT